MLTDLSQVAGYLAREIGTNYWLPMSKYLEENPKFNKTFTKFLLNSEEIIFYLGKTHLGIEYIGNPSGPDITESVWKLKLVDYSNLEGEMIDEIIGFQFKGSATSNFRMPLPSITEDLILPTNEGMDMLSELKWNFAAQNGIIGFNTNGIETTKGHFHRIINGLFFDVGLQGLKTRHIKWLDLLPLTYDDSGIEADIFSVNLNPLLQLIEHDVEYIYPLPDKDDFKYNKLPQINRFIEVLGDQSNSETDITSFLAKDENRFILTMGFLSKHVYPELEFEWQSEEKNAIRPDFMIEKPNGYCDIVEFKLPRIKGNAVVGTSNRATFSAEINSYISQTRTYRTYFEDPNNRSWSKNTFDIEVHNPKRTLVIGRRSDFKAEEWRDIISDYRDIEIMTFDDLIDGVVAQFYM